MWYVIKPQTITGLQPGEALWRAKHCTAAATSSLFILAALWNVNFFLGKGVAVSSALSSPSPVPCDWFSVCLWLIIFFHLYTRGYLVSRPYFTVMQPSLLKIELLIIFLLALNSGNVTYRLNWFLIILSFWDRRKYKKEGLLIIQKNQRVPGTKIVECVTYQ